MSKSPTQRYRKEDETTGQKYNFNQY